MRASGGRPLAGQCIWRTTAIVDAMRNPSCPRDVVQLIYLTKTILYFYLCA